MPIRVREAPVDNNLDAAKSGVSVSFTELFFVSTLRQSSRLGPRLDLESELRDYTETDSAKTQEMIRLTP